MKPAAPASRARLACTTVPCLALLGGCPALEPSALDPMLDLPFNTGARPAPADTAGPAVLLRMPVFEAIPGRAGHHAPAVTGLPDGALLAAWYSYSGPAELDGAAVYVARRPAGAGAWEAPALRVERAVSAANPVLYAEGQRIWLFYAVVPGGWSTARVEVQRSEDGGRTWAAPAGLAGPLGTNVRHPPVRLADGALLLPAYDDLRQRALFFASDDDGASWALRAAVATGRPERCIQPSLAALPGGRLLAVLRNTGGGWLWVTASDDGGRTWALPADSGLPNPGSPAVLLPLAGGGLVLVFNDSATARRPLSIAISGDGGRSWHPPRVLVDGAGEYAYPAAVQTPDGLIHVLYSHDRARIEHTTASAAWVRGEE